MHKKFQPLPTRPLPSNDLCDLQPASKNLRDAHYNLSSLPQHNAKLTSSVTAAVELAVTECRHQFRFDAWNCPEAAFGADGGGGGGGGGAGDFGTGKTHKGSVRDQFTLDVFPKEYTTEFTKRAGPRLRKCIIK